MAQHNHINTGSMIELPVNTIFTYGASDKKYKVTIDTHNDCLGCGFYDPAYEDEHAGGCKLIACNIKPYCGRTERKDKQAIYYPIYNPMKKRYRPIQTLEEYKISKQAANKTTKQICVIVALITLAFLLLTLK